MYQNLEKKWFVVQVKPNSYDIAIRNLERQGFKTFLPKTRVTVRKKNIFLFKDSYVFSGYMFVGVDTGSVNWTKIKNTYGVSKILVFNNKPSVIPNDLIMALKTQYEGKIAQLAQKDFNQGDLIKFNSGPFLDLIAKIESVDNRMSIYVLLEMMGGQRKLKVNLNEKINFIKV
jgi:transcriptional antiterminator RfaH